MAEIVSYDPYAEKFTFNHDSNWIETLWAVIYAENLSETAKIIFATLISHVYVQPLSYPTQKSLSEAMHKTDRTVRRAMKELKDRHLVAVPPGFSGRSKKYIIYEHSGTDLKFSMKAESMLKSLLDINVSLFSLTGEKAVKCEAYSETPDKNVLSLQEKEKEKKREEREEEKKVIQRKEEEKEERKKEREKELALCASEIPYKSDKTEKDKKSKVKTSSNLKNSGAYNFMAGDEKPSLTQAMKEPKIKKSRPSDIHQWGTLDFESYFKERYKKLTGKNLSINFAKERTLIKKMIKRTTDIEEVKDVVDYVFDNWRLISKKFGFDDQFPTISLVFSQWFGTFLTMMHKGKPKANHFIDKRSDFQYKMPEGIYEE